MKLLLLDDSHTVLSLISESLANEGYDVVACSSIIEANEQIANTRNNTDDFDCVITGLNMPAYGLTENEMAEAQGSMLAGWIWLKNYIMSKRKKVGKIILSGFVEVLLRSLPPSETSLLNDVYLLSKADNDIIGKLWLMLKRIEDSKTTNIPQYRYGNGAIASSNILIDREEIIVPSPEIIASLEVVNYSLLSAIKNDESFIDRLTPREFEELVCEVLDKNGLTVKLTKQTCDGGKDIIVCENKLIGNFLTYVECKKYRKDRPVAVNLVRELYGAVMADNVTAGLLITSSYFSREAEAFTEKVKNRMSLMDYNGLFQVILKTNS